VVTLSAQTIASPVRFITEMLHTACSIGRIILHGVTLPARKRLLTDHLVLLEADFGHAAKLPGPSVWILANVAAALRALVFPDDSAGHAAFILSKTATKPITARNKKGR